MEKLDKIYVTQVGFSLLTVIFCIAMIGMDPVPSTTSIFLPILTSVVGVWLPQPQNKVSTGSRPGTDPVVQEV